VADLAKARAAVKAASDECHRRYRHPMPCERCEGLTQALAALNASPEPADVAGLAVLSDYLKDHGAHELLSAVEDPVKELLELRARVEKLNLVEERKEDGHVARLRFEHLDFECLPQNSRWRSLAAIFGVMRDALEELAEGAERRVEPQPQPMVGLLPRLLESEQRREGWYASQPTARAYGISNDGQYTALRADQFGRFEVPPNVPMDRVRVVVVNAPLGELARPPSPEQVVRIADVDTEAARREGYKLLAKAGRAVAKKSRVPQGLKPARLDGRGKKRKR
jgi:hypothetical protein